LIFVDVVNMSVVTNDLCYCEKLFFGLFETLCFLIFFFFRFSLFWINKVIFADVRYSVLSFGVVQQELKCSFERTNSQCHWWLFLQSLCIKRIVWWRVCQYLWNQDVISKVYQVIGTHGFCFFWKAVKNLLPLNVIEEI
jgi:hypothetical protein